MCHVVGMGWSFVVQGAHDQTLLAIVRRAVCAQPARARPPAGVVENAGTVAPHQLDQLVLLTVSSL